MRVVVLLVASLGFVLAALAGCGGGGLPAAEDPTPLAVMTWNVYYGADLTPAMIAVDGGDPDAIVAAVTGAWAQVEATDFASRAAAIANAIAKDEPHVVGLQEAALWRRQSPSDTFTADPTPATEVALDMLQVLMDELASRGLSYEVAQVLETFDAELPYLGPTGELDDLRVTDREVVLVRTGHGALDVQVEATQTGLFAAHLMLPSGLEIPQGWIALDGSLQGLPFRVISTHLEADYAPIRLAQAQELLDGPALADRPVVMLGDFNADALAGGNPTYELLTGGTFRDVVDACSLAAAALPTSGRDADLGLLGTPLQERVDLVLSNDQAAICYGTWRVGVEPAEAVGNLWPSDHAGVVALLGLGALVQPALRREEVRP